MRRWLAWALSLLFALPAAAQAPTEALRLSDGIREWRGTLADGDSLRVRLEGLEAGMTIYALGSGVGRFDAYLLLNDAQGQAVYNDDDSGGGLNAYFAFTLDAGGDYELLFTSVAGSGIYVLRAGINTPELAPASPPADPTGYDCRSVTLALRPELSGPVERRETPNFVVHYTFNGADATTPIWVQTISAALERSYAVQLNDLGWRIPPRDCGEGGDTRYDVYIKDLSADDVLGLASSDNVIGDNALTERRESYAAYSHLLLDNDLAYEPPARARQLISTTAAHEFHHSVQYGYDYADPLRAAYEMGAMWMETRVFPYETDAADYVEYVLATPDLCLGSDLGRSDLRMYGEWLFVESFTRDLGSDAYEAVWSYLAFAEGLPALYEALNTLGMSIEEAITRYAIRNLLRDYAQADAPAFGRVTLAGIATPDGVFIPPDGVQAQGVEYVQLPTAGDYQLTLDAAPNFRLTLVGIVGAQATSWPLSSGEVVALAGYDHAYLIVQNTQRHSDPSACTYSAWQLRLSASAAPSAPPAPTTRWDATRFLPPS